MNFIDRILGKGEDDHPIDEQLTAALEELSNRDDLTDGQRKGVGAYASKVKAYKALLLPMLRDNRTRGGLADATEAYRNDGGEIGPSTRRLMENQVISSAKGDGEFARGARLAAAIHGQVLSRGELKNQRRQ